MFKNVEDVKNHDVDSLYDLVKSESYNADLSTILSEDLLHKYHQAITVKNEIEDITEKIAFAIKDRIVEQFEEDGEENDIEDEIHSFMSSIAYSMGLEYGGWGDTDSFWEQSNC